MARVGVLSLQGDFALHAELLEGLGVDVLGVRRPDELQRCDALVLPGGESTTLSKLIDRAGMRHPLEQFVGERPVFGTCAGCILLARDIEDAGGVRPLGRLDLTVRRNGFGRQIDSFEAPIVVTGEADAVTPTSAFIRAPRITRVGEGLGVLGRWSGEVVAVRDGDVVALTFHPEVCEDPSWHRAWLARAGLVPSLPG
jgi:pyridoxal 5'-phosphate synthase pdxT subunit